MIIFKNHSSMILQIINNKATFSTISKLHADRDLITQRNKHITDSNERIEPVSSPAVDKSLTSDKLLDLFEETKQQIDSNVNSVSNLISEANKLQSKLNRAYNRSKGELTESQQEFVGNALAANTNYLDKDENVYTAEQKSLLDISKSQKKIVDVLFKVKYLQDNLPSGQKEGNINRREGYLNESEEMIKEFNGLSSNITKLLAKQSAVQRELYTKNNTSHFVQDSSDVVQTDFSSFDPFEE